MGLREIRVAIKREVILEEAAQSPENSGVPRTLTRPQGDDPGKLRVAEGIGDSASITLCVQPVGGSEFVFVYVHSTYLQIRDYLVSPTNLETREFSGETVDSLAKMASSVLSGVDRLDQRLVDEKIGPQVIRNRADLPSYLVQWCYGCIDTGEVYRRIKSLD